MLVNCKLPLFPNLVVVSHNIRPDGKGGIVVAVKFRDEDPRDTSPGEKFVVKWFRPFQHNERWYLMPIRVEEDANGNLIIGRGMGKNFVK